MRYLGGLLGLALLVCAIPVVLATHENTTNMTEDLDDENTTTGSVISAIDAARTQNDTSMNETDTESRATNAGEGGVIYVVLMEEEIRPAQESEIPEINEWLEDIGSTVPDEDEIIMPENTTTAFTGFGDDTFVSSDNSTFESSVFNDNRSDVFDDENDSGSFQDEEAGAFEDDDTTVGGIY